MHCCSAVPFVAVLALVVAPPASAQKEVTVLPSAYVVVPHMKGSLALQIASITGLWYVPAREGKVGQLRVSSTALPEAKTLSGADAEGLWATLSARREDFLLTGHLGGTLAIPRSQVRAAYYAVDSGAARLRLTYDGDPGGKTVDGEEATSLWKELQR